MNHYISRIDNDIKNPNWVALDNLVKINKKNNNNNPKILKTVGEDAREKFCSDDKYIFIKMISIKILKLYSSKYV